MLKSKFANFFLIFTFIASNAFANSYLRPEFLKVKKYGCLVEEKSVVSENDELSLSNELEQKDENKHEIVENNENFEEKKKTGFFSMLSNLMTSDKKTPEVVDKSIENKIKRKKTKVKFQFIQ